MLKTNKFVLVAFNLKPDIIIYYVLLKITQTFLFISKGTFILFINDTESWPSCCVRVYTNRQKGYSRFYSRKGKRKRSLEYYREERVKILVSLVQ